MNSSQKLLSGKPNEKKRCGSRENDLILLFLFGKIRHILIMQNRKRIIIVGATSGLGRGLAECYISKGCQVGIVGRRSEILAEMAEGRQNVYKMTADVTDLHTVTECLERLRNEMGGMDCLVLCSGVGRINPELDFHMELPTVDTNVRGWTAVVDWAFLFFMKQGYGQLAAISSVAGLCGLAPAPAYAASKAYQIHYLESLRQRVRIAKKKVVVTDIRPGFVRTPLLGHPERLFWVDEPEKAVSAIHKVIESGRAAAVITRRWACLAPLMKIAPEWLVAMILRKA